jgi:uncharacterized protein
MKGNQLLVDTGILVAFYDAADPQHQNVFEFLGQFRGQLITTLSCVTETMWLLAKDHRVQTEFLRHLSLRIYHCEPLIPEDFERILALNQQYKDIPADFADLSLVIISERLNIPSIATLDRDFDIYRRYRNQPFNRVFYPK